MSDEPGKVVETIKALREWKHHALPRPMEILSLELKLYEGGSVAIQLQACMRAKNTRDEAEAYYKECKEELAQIQLAEGLDGLRHNNIVFRCREVAGRVSYPYEKLVHGMHLEGLSAESIERVMAFARKEGANYFVKEIGTE